MQDIVLQFKILGTDKTVDKLTDIDLEAKKIQTSVKKVEKELAALDKQLSGNNSPSEARALGLQYDETKAKLIGFKRQQFETREEAKLLRKELRDQARDFQKAKFPKDSIVGLEREYSKLRKQIRGLTKDERKAFGSELVGRSRALKDEIRELSEELGDTTPNIGNYQEAIQRALRGQGSFTENLGSLGKNFLKVAGPIAAAGLALKGLQTLYVDGKAALLEYDEALANIQKTTGLNRDQADLLSSSLRELNTRTSNQDLNLLASAAGRLGINDPEEIIGFVEAIDKTYVALGDSLEGTAEEIGLSIGKIAENFGLVEKFGQNDALIKVGSVINELGANSKAQEKNILDFTNRLSGVASIAGFAQPEIASLGALFDETGQSIETAATTLNVLIPALGKDVEGFAKTAGVTNEEFKQLITVSPFEALVKVAEGARSADDGILGLTETLDKLGVESARGAAIVGTLANNTDRLRELSDLANTSLEEGVSITNEFNIKNNTLQAQTEKTTKAYNDFLLSVDSGNGFISQTVILWEEIKQGALGYFSAVAEQDPTDRYVKEGQELESLLVALIKNKDNMQVRNGVIEELQRSHPEYIKNIDLETASYEDLTGILTEYTNIAGKNRDQLVLENQKNELLQKQRGLIEEIVDLNKKVGTRYFGFQETFVTLAIEGYQKELDGVNTELEEMEENLKNIEKPAQVFTSLRGRSSNTLADQLGRSKSAVEAWREEVLSTEEGTERYEEAIEGLSKAQKRYTELLDLTKVKTDAAGAGEVKRKKGLELLRQEIGEINKFISDNPESNNLEKKFEALIKKEKELTRLEDKLKNIKRLVANDTSDLDKLEEFLNKQNEDDLFQLDKDEKADIKKFESKLEDTDIDKDEAIEIIKDIEKVEAEKERARVERILAGNKLIADTEKEQREADEEAAKKKAKADEDRAKNLADLRKTLQDGLGEAFQAAFEIQRDAIDRNLENEKDAIDQQTEAKIKQAGGIKELEEAAAAEGIELKKEADRKAAREKQKIRIKEAIAETALAVIKALPNPFAVAGALLAGGIQLAVIRSQKFAGGGFTGDLDIPGSIIGKRDETGEKIAGLVHANEWVAKRTFVEKNPRLFKELNQMQENFKLRGFADGGFTSQVIANDIGNLATQQNVTRQEVFVKVAFDEDSAQMIGDKTAASIKDTVPKAVGDAVYSGSLDAGQDATRLSERKKFSEEINEF